MLKQLFWNSPATVDSVLTAMPDDPESVLGKQSYSAFFEKQLQSTSSNVLAFTMLIILLILNRVQTVTKGEFISECCRDGVLARLSDLESHSSSLSESEELVLLISVVIRLFGPDCAAKDKDTEKLRLASEAILKAEGYDAIVESLKQLRDALTAGRSGASSYELTQSKAIGNLKAFFVSPPAFRGRKDTAFQKKYNLICDRLRAFITVFLDDAFSDTTSGESCDGSKSAVKLLIERLVESLSSSPSFKAFDYTPFFTVPTSGNPLERLASRSMRLLHQSFRIQLRRHENETTLQDIERESFNIDAFAGMKAIEDFLLGRVGSAPSPPQIRIPPSMPPAESVTLQRDKMNAINEHKLMFTIEGRLLDPEDSMIDIIRNSSQAKSFMELFSVTQKQTKENEHPLIALFDIVYPVKYQLVTEKTWLEAHNAKPRREHAPPPVVPPQFQPLPYFLVTYSSLFTGIHEALCDEETKLSLELLDILYHINRHARAFMYPGKPVIDSPVLPRSLFVSHKLTSLFEQQMSDPLVQCFPDSIVSWGKFMAENRLRFLLSEKSRHTYFKLRFTRLPRVVTQFHWDEQVVKRMVKPKKRVVVSRKNMLKSAVSLMKTIGRSSELDVEYEGEPGIGLGPVLEYFSIVSHEVQQKSLKAFVDESTEDDEASQFINNPNGLFPVVMDDPSGLISLNSSNLLEFTAINPSGSYQDKIDKRQLFFFIGAFVATAIVDGRILDANFSPTFLKILIGDEPVSFEDMARSHGSLFRTLFPLVNAVRKGETTLDGLPVEELALTMTVPGSDIELVPKGKDTTVDGKSLPVYVEKLVNVVLSSGVETPLDCFNLGLRHILVFDDDRTTSPFSVFEPTELSQILSGADDKHVWDRDTILTSMTAENGFDKTSPTIQNLVNIMVSFTGQQRRLFLLFVTGSPRLPIGGFPSLNPKFTVSCKRPVINSSSSPAGRLETDSMLPSANCCFSLLKLPSYSTPEILRERLLYAIENCQGSFDLS